MIVPDLLFPFVLSQLEKKISSMFVFLLFVCAASFFHKWFELDLQ